MRAWNSFTHSGLANAERLAELRPWIASRTADSEILPLTVRGIAETARIFLGTWCGLAWVRSVL